MKTERKCEESEWGQKQVDGSLGREEKQMNRERRLETALNFMAR